MNQESTDQRIREILGRVDRINRNLTEGFLSHIDASLEMIQGWTNLNEETIDEIQQGLDKDKG